MATVKWIGASLSRAQVNTLTIAGTPAAGNTVGVTINGKNVTYTVLSGDAAADIATGLAAALRSAVDGEFSLMTYDVSGAVITCTAATPGIPFTATGAGTLTATATGGGATNTAASAVTNKSPNDVNDTDNWSGGALPSASDTVIVENTDQGMYWNLSALSAITLAALKFRPTFAPTDRDCWVGNPTIHPDLGFREFRGTELTLQGATVLEIALADSAAAGAFRVNVGAVACALKVTGTSAGAIGAEQVWWRGTENTSNAIEVYGGSLVIDPIHFSTSGTAKLQTLKIISGTVRIEAGVTVNTSAWLRDSTLDSRVAIPSLTVTGDDSAVAIRDAATCTAAAIDAGYVNWLSTGTLTAVKIGSGATLDFSGSDAATTVGNATGAIKLSEGASYLDPNRRTIPFGAADYMLLDRCGLDKVTVDFGEHIYLQANVGP